MLLVCVLSCNSKNSGETQRSKFDESEWAVKVGDKYPHREKMVDDFVDNYRSRNYTRDKLLNVLGAADRIDSNYLFYRISQDKFGVLPIRTKTMVVKFSDDSTIEWIKIHGGS